MSSTRGGELSYQDLRNPQECHSILDVLYYPLLYCTGLVCQRCVLVTQKTLMQINGSCRLSDNALVYHIHVWPEDSFVIQYMMHAVHFQPELVLPHYLGPSGLLGVHNSSERKV